MPRSSRNFDDAGSSPPYACCFIFGFALLIIGGAVIAYPHGYRDDDDHSNCLLMLPNPNQNTTGTYETIMAPAPTQNPLIVGLILIISSMWMMGFGCGAALTAKNKEIFGKFFDRKKGYGAIELNEIESVTVNDVLVQAEKGYLSSPSQPK